MLNYINYPAVRFRKTNISHEELKSVFYDKEQEGYLWMIDYVNAFLDGNVEIVNQLSQNTNVSLMKFLIDKLLHFYTINENEFKYWFNILSLVNDGYLHGVIQENFGLKILTQDGVIYARRLDVVAPEIVKLFPDINSRKRIGNCHQYCLMFADSFDAEYDIVTGYVAPLSNKNKNLHSWIELDLFGEEVIDFTRGMMFNKKGYYLLKNIDEKAVQHISRQTYLEDKPMLIELYKKDSFLTKLYLANRDEALAVYQNSLQ